MEAPLSLKQDNTGLCLTSLSLLAVELVSDRLGFPSPTDASKTISPSLVTPYTEILPQDLLPGEAPAKHSLTGSQHSVPAHRVLASINCVLHQCTD